MSNGLLFDDLYREPLAAPAPKADPNSVIFVPTPEVLEAFRKAVRG